MSLFWYKKIEAQYRLRIGRELTDEVTWLSASQGSDGQCDVIVGGHGQALFFPPGTARELVPEIDRALAVPVQLGEVNAPWLEYMRFAAAQWSVKWSFESAGNRFVFNLTRELHHVGVLPDEKGRVAVFATGGFFEVWKADCWIDHAKELGRDLNGLTTTARESLEDR